jgi:CDP-6-deoxy-D-xylo-4-hexulose-3-dehydrase
LISLAAETISRDDLESLSSWILAGNRLTKGEETLAFEEEFAREVGTSQAVFVNSGSSANLLMAAALKESGRLRNNIVIAPAVGWVTTVTPFLQLGFEVKLCDADPFTLGLDISHLQALVEEHQPSALILVHVLGHPNQMQKIKEICRAYDVVLLEDACEALGSISDDGSPLGSIGLAGSYSFYYGHHISTIEGGMIATSDEEFHQLLVALRSHGWSRDLDSAQRSALATQYEVDSFRDLYTSYFAGYNVRSTDLQAHIGRRQLRRVMTIAEIRASLAQVYAEALPDFFRQVSQAQVVSWFAYGTLVKSPQLAAARLKEAGIESRPLICGNLGRHPFWTRRYGHAKLHVADQVHDFGIYLPIHTSMAAEQVQYVAETLASAAEPHNLELN